MITVYLYTFTGLVILAHFLFFIVVTVEILSIIKKKDVNPSLPREERNSL